MPKKPRILVVNDDGIDGAGLAPLLEALVGIGTLTALVPARERSTVSHSLTLHKPLRCRRADRATFPRDVRVFSLNGSPADCSRIGILSLLRGRVDLVVSGINDGYNLGHDVLYSGTVAAAREAVLLGVPAFAVSKSSRDGRDYSPAGAFARRLALQVLGRGLPKGVCLNVNMPETPAPRIRGAKATSLGRRVYSQRIVSRRDPAGRPYHWIGGRYLRSEGGPGTDVAAVRSGYVSVTPLGIDSTEASFLGRLKRWKLS